VTNELTPEVLARMKRLLPTADNPHNWIAVNNWMTTARLIMDHAPALLAAVEERDLLREQLVIVKRVAGRIETWSKLDEPQKVRELAAERDALQARAKELEAEVARHAETIIELSLREHALQGRVKELEERRSNMPPVVCLCGSTRFMEAFQQANLEETIAGRIVLSIGCNTKSDSDLLALGKLTEGAKAMLDELHKRKIDLSDEVLVLNVGGYIGESTRSEIAYAVEHGKPVRYLEPQAPDVTEPDASAQSVGLPTCTPPGGKESLYTPPGGLGAAKAAYNGSKPSCPTPSTALTDPTP